MRLAETIGRWFGRVEVVLAGAEGLLREGEDALAARDPMRARATAHAILQRVPGSPLGLALLADACEAAGLEAELALTLEDLAARVASRADVWVRLGRARTTQGGTRDEARDAYVRAIAVAESGSDARREALLALADLDLAQGDGARAELWLERIADPRAPDVALRRAEAFLSRGAAAEAIAALAESTGRDAEDTTNGRSALARGRALAMTGNADAFAPLLRAYVLETPGASDALSSALAWVSCDESVRARARAVVEGQGEARTARFRAAFARADGHPDEARAALREAVVSGDASAARALLEAALDDHDYSALLAALAATGHDHDADPLVRDARRIPSPVALSDASRTAAVLDDLARVTTERARAWADAARRESLGRWLPARGLAVWPDVLARLDSHARNLRDLESIAKLAALSEERGRPVRVAIVGEFNAGKSTFINALMGADVAPTGVLPTTATLHHLRYAPDPIARIVFHPDDAGGTKRLDRLLPLADLRAALKSLDTGDVKRVELCLPMPFLTRVEILDTPGFNAPDPRHAAAARTAFDEADAVVWLFDAGQALKQTERTILEEARAVGLPVQILVNKADRLGPADLAKVMQLVHESLEELRLVSWTPPVALSARLALAGKLGDADALEKSGWARVDELLATDFVGRSDELKERGLRRRARGITRDLEMRARDDRERERAAIAHAKERAHAAGLLAARMDREAEERAQRLSGALSQAADAWRRDLDVLVAGRDARAAESDPILARYRVDRAVTRLAPPLARVLAQMAKDGASVELRGADEDDFAPLARALVRAFAAAAGSDLLLLCRAAIATLTERLGALATAPAEEGEAAGLAAELEAIVSALVVD